MRKAGTGARDFPYGPLYSKIKLTVMSRIADGEYPIGHRLPSELELVDAFGVSRMTVNRALRELTQEGVLVRTPGVGTFVAERQPQSPLVELSDIADEINDRGHEHSSRIILLSSEKCTMPVAQALGLDRHRKVFHSTVVHSENDIPVVLEDRFVLPSFAPNYLKQDFESITPYVYLLSCGPVSELEHTLNAMTPTATVAKRLRIDRTDPCLHLIRRTWSGKNVVTYNHFYYPGSRYRLSSRYKLSKYQVDLDG